MSSVTHAPAFVVSLDFEQAWGSEAHRLHAAEVAALLGARRAIPRMLDIAERRGVGLTWATVGLLFFGHREEMLAGLPEQRPAYADARMDAYSRLDEVGASERDDPLHFGRTLLLQIRDCPRQEIASHTFSHYYALEDGDDPDAFAADLRAARHAAERLGISLESLVFPRNQVNPAYLPLCAAAGLRSFRGAQPGRSHRARSRREERPWHRAGRLAGSYSPIGAAPVSRLRQTDGLVNVPATRFLRPARKRRSFLVPAQLGRIRADMENAARAGGLFHLWWHPQNFGTDTELNLTLFDTILETYRILADRYGMVSATMAEIGRADLARSLGPAEPA